MANKLSNNQHQKSFECYLPELSSGSRIDIVLTELLKDFSRSTIQKWITSGNITVDGETPRSRDIVYGGEHVFVFFKEDIETEYSPEDLPLNIVYEDEHVLVLNKPDGFVMHPGAGNQNGTLLNGLLFHFPDLKMLPRAGIVHRLDKDTSGLVVVAKTSSARKNLVEQLQEHKIKREYVALIWGDLLSGGTIDFPISRHKVNRKKMSIQAQGKPAITHYSINKRYRTCTLLNVKLETGRTHQIRVHMLHNETPIVGDRVYKRKQKIIKHYNNDIIKQLTGFHRQALHAKKISFQHPKKLDFMTFESRLPDDFQTLLQLLNSGSLEK
ncbi:MAG: 23S rRNA pseudouridine(1911/1915/1917) synthase RluD [Pseudomonadota bacterium]